jgi:pimeloyl-ACP methyl ester carboxylesterase
MMLKMDANAKRNYRKLVPDDARECFVQVNGLRIRYISAGSGPPLVLVHGLLGFSMSWSENISLLAKKFTVFALDMPNLGYSERKPVDASLDGHARWLAAFLDALNLQRADIMASSHGGGMVLNFAMLFPPRCGKLVLVSPVNPFSEVERWIVDFMQTWLGRRFARTLVYMPYFIRKRWLGRMYTDLDRALPGTVEEYTRAVRQQGTIDHVLLILKTWFSDIRRLDARLDELQGGDIHLVWGEKDELVLVKSGRKLAERLQIPITVIPDCGHLPYEEKPDEFNRVMRAIFNIP